MGWKGGIFGSWIGGMLGGPLGALIGAAIGHKVENATKGKSSSAYRGAADAKRAARQTNSAVFCGSAAAMFAKMAKADGIVTADEIAAVENAFRQLGFTSEARSFAVGVFRKAKDDSHSIYEYAADFAAAVQGLEARTFFYELLWQLACADGKLTRGEDAILRNITRYLRIPDAWYQRCKRMRHWEDPGDESRYSRSSASPRQEEEDPYSVLGISRNSSLEEAKRAYRELAKRHHPDVLRAQGVPEELVARASERMSRINAAWNEIQKRG